MSAEMIAKQVEKDVFKLMEFGVASTVVTFEAVFLAFALWLYVG